MSKGWLCPKCGSAHGPHIDTCPDGGVLPVYPMPSVPRWPPGTGDPTPWGPYPITCGPNTCMTVEVKADPNVMIWN